MYNGVGAQSPRVLVTGASGFVGSQLTLGLARRGDFRVRTLSRSFCAGFPDSVDQLVSVAPFEAGALAQAVADVDYIIHCAGRAHVMDNLPHKKALQAYREVNVDYSVRLANSALEAGVKRLIYLSSVKVNGESTGGRPPFHPLDEPKPEDAYGLSKWEAEQAIKEALGGHCEWVVVRPPLVYGGGVKGNFARLQAAVTARKPLPLGLLNNKRSLISVSNLVDFLMFCLRHPRACGNVFIPCDQQDLSVRELVLRLASAGNVRPVLLPVPVWCLTLAGRLLGQHKSINRLCGSLLVDHSHTKDWLGWTAPSVPFEKSG
ncbi:NAD-dependent epimerase/dehydratase family protein [Marinobacter sp. VGCF2001]|uniref:NAD-dependent epimerase/dehydratase family protein n=1 Tax=Marinobacter sp. VGCF2001 TaxID=3417189 RepID=UPI003CFB3DDD